MRAAALFAQAWRCHAKHGHEGENGSASANLDNDVAAQLPERTTRRPFARVHSERRRKPKPIDRRERQHDEEQDRWYFSGYRSGLRSD